MKEKKYKKIDVRKKSHRYGKVLSAIEQIYGVTVCDGV